MARYDTSLARERGAVRAGQNRDYSDYRSAYGYDRDMGPRDATYWRRPSQLRGYRGGSAFSYGGGTGGRERGGRGAAYDRDYGPGGAARPIRRQRREERRFQAERAAPGENDYTWVPDTGRRYGSNYDPVRDRAGVNFYGGRYGADYFRGRGRGTRGGAR